MPPYTEPPAVTRRREHLMTAVAEADAASSRAYEAYTEARLTLRRAERDLEVFADTVSMFDPNQPADGETAHPKETR